jgi:hypothetical protein
MPLRAVAVEVQCHLTADTGTQRVDPPRFKQSEKFAPKPQSSLSNRCKHGLSRILRKKQLAMLVHVTTRHHRPYRRHPSKRGGWGVGTSLATHAWPTSLGRVAVAHVQGSVPKAAAPGTHALLVPTARLCHQLNRLRRGIRECARF